MFKPHHGYAIYSTYVVLEDKLGANHKYIVLLNQ